MPVKKVFERNGITLYHGDCMELMKDIPAKAFQMAIVDPPYGAGGTGTDFAGGHASAAGSTNTRRGHSVFGTRKKYYTARYPEKLGNGLRSKKKIKFHGMSRPVRNISRNCSGYRNGKLCGEAITSRFRRGGVL